MVCIRKEEYSPAILLRRRSFWDRKWEGKKKKRKWEGDKGELFIRVSDKMAVLILQVGCILLGDSVVTSATVLDLKLELRGDMLLLIFLIIQSMWPFVVCGSEDICRGLFFPSTMSIPKTKLMPLGIVICQSWSFLRYFVSWYAKTWHIVISSPLVSIPRGWGLPCHWWSVNRSDNFTQPSEWFFLFSFA